MVRQQHHIVGFVVYMNYTALFESGWGRERGGGRITGLLNCMFFFFVLCSYTIENDYSVFLHNVHLCNEALPLRTHRYNHICFFILLRSSIAPLVTESKGLGVGCDERWLDETLGLKDRVN
ncbi:hypothetical protein F4678DRAFT_151554 [Xylaria arbuscula]|nr:hypothetical protein F4678DRAFT_151554 [Xylaria arbuscula]